MNSRRRFCRAGGPAERRAGFTLIEIMVVIALMGLLATVLAVGASRALIDRVETPEEMFWLAVAEARKFALQNEVDVRLSFDAENQSFRAATDLGVRDVPLPTGEPIELDFLGVGAGDQTVMIGGRLVETNELDSVTFFSDGTCTPFRVRLSRDGGEPLILEIDPWTCAPILRGGGDRV